MVTKPPIAIRLPGSKPLLHGGRDQRTMVSSAKSPLAWLGCTVQRPRSSLASRCTRYFFLSSRKDRTLREDQQLPGREEGPHSKSDLYPAMPTSAIRALYPYRESCRDSHNTLLEFSLQNFIFFAPPFLSNFRF